MHFIHAANANAAVTAYKEQKCRSASASIALTSVPARFLLFRDDVQWRCVCGNHRKRLQTRLDFPITLLRGFQIVGGSQCMLTHWLNASKDSPSVSILIFLYSFSAPKPIRSPMMETCSFISKNSDAMMLFAGGRNGNYWLWEPQVYGWFVLLNVYGNLNSAFLPFLHFCSLWSGMLSSLG